MNHCYETMVLLDNREVKQGWDALKSNVAGLFTKHHAEVVSARRWAERRLAYPIKGQLRATYLLVYHNTPTKELEKIERELRFSEAVLRHMTTTCEAVPEEAYTPEAEFDPDSVPLDDEQAIEVEASEPDSDSEDSDSDDSDSDDTEDKDDA